MGTNHNHDHLSESQIVVCKHPLNVAVLFHENLSLTISFGTSKMSMSFFRDSEVISPSLWKKHVFPSFGGVMV